MLNIKKADGELVHTLEETPLNLYDTLIYLSVKDHPTQMEQDFVIHGGERYTEIMTEHFAQMLVRHPEFKKFVNNAVVLALEYEIDNALNTSKN